MAQLGSAPALGAGSRRFESSHPDHFKFKSRHPDNFLNLLLGVEGYSKRMSKNAHGERCSL